MNKTVRTFGFVSMTALMLVLSACKNKNPSVMKVFVRNENNELQASCKVIIIIADVTTTSASPEYVDTLLTNSSGFAQFDMQAFFDQLPKDQSTGYFDVLAKKDGAEGTDYLQARAHITTVSKIIIAQ